MTSKLKILVTSTVATVALMGSNPAFAAGTDAGTSITNTVTVNYNVGGTAQTTENDSDTFVVDRKVNLLVAASDALNTTVAPDEDDAAVTFDVTNLTNDTIDILLTSEQPVSDDFDVGTVTYYLDDGDGIFNVADSVIVSINDIAEDDTVTIHAVADVPNGLITGNLSDLILVGQAADSTTGVAFADNSGDADDAAVVQNVFADADGTGTEVANDGYHSATDTYIVAAADITVAKTSVVLWDPINGTTNPKSIPGAIIEYCIAVDNASGGADATGVAISDAIPANLSYYSTLSVGPATVPSVIGVVTEGTVTGAVCNADGGSTGSESGGTVSGNLGTITAGSAETLVFRVTVD